MSFSSRCAARAAWLILILSLAACHRKEEVSASQPQGSSSVKLAQKSEAGPVRQYQCRIDPVNWQLDLGNIGRNGVVPLPSIGAMPLRADTLLLDATSPQDAANRIMQAKTAYQRVPPQCSLYPLSIRDLPVDTATPPASYVPLNPGPQLVSLFYAVSKIAPPYDEIARQLYPDYRNEPDAFKRQDRLKILQPEIDRQIKEESAEGRHLLVMDTRVALSHYDPATHSFPITLHDIDGFRPGAYVSWSSSGIDYRQALQISAYRIGFDAGKKADLRYIPADENEARALETKVTTLTNGYADRKADLLPARLYFQVLKAAIEDKAKTLMARPVKLEVFVTGCTSCKPGADPEQTVLDLDLR